MKGGKMKHYLTISGKLDNLNDYTSACRKNRYAGAEMKRKNENKVIASVLEQLRRLRIEQPVYMTYNWYEKNKRRDLDNISSFGRKVIQDALVETKVLRNDNWQCIVGFQDNFYTDPAHPRIEVIIEEVEK